MRAAAAFLLVLPLLACSGSADPDRNDLERVYVRMVDAAAPGRETPVEEREALRAAVDSLGGPARVESLLAASMENEPRRWKELLDSLASRSP